MALHDGRAPLDLPEAATEPAETPGAGAPVRLRCEDLVDPVGIDELRPRLSWLLDDPRSGGAQAAYQVQVASSPDRLLAGDADRWDSGRVEHPDPFGVVYRGRPLASRDRCWWRVRTWDPHGAVSPWSSPARFETGLLAGSDWQGLPVRAPWRGDRATGAPVPLLRRSFRLPAPAATARLYVTALGLYDVTVNGQPVTDDVFRPGWTDYRIRVPHQVHDVTELLVPGENVIGAMLGDGWYCGHTVLAWGRQGYGDRPALLLQLEAALRDGGRVVVATDEHWRVATGPVVRADHYDGEVVDHRLARPGWGRPGFDDGSWQPAELAAPILAAVVGTRIPPVRRTQELPAVTVTEVRPGVHVADFGQNLAGWVRLPLDEPAGTTVRIRHGEMLHDDGSLYTENLGTAAATDEITSAGEPVIAEPRFTYHGFRYAEITGLTAAPDPERVTAVAVHTDLEVTGSFHCSDPLVDALQRSIVWSQRANSFEVPTDCPQRSERLGWTGDVLAYAATAAFNLDVAAFLAKWRIDLDDAQLTGGIEDGEYPQYAPRGAQVGGGPGWSDAAVEVPWVLHQVYGDRRVLERHWQPLLRWMDFLDRRASGLAPGAAEGFGDWLSLDRDPAAGEGPDDRYGGTPRALLAALFHVRACDRMAAIASVLGRAAERSRFTRRAAELRAELARRWAPDGRLTVRTQTALTLATVFDALRGAARDAAMRDLAADVEHRGHLTTGFLGTPHLLDALTAAGRLDLAYRLLEREEAPSWLAPIRAGATTTWERWDGWTPEGGFADPSMNSFNHYNHGAVGDWLYRVVGGLGRDPAFPGYGRVVVWPRPGGRRITAATTRLRSVRGDIAVEWSLDGQVMDLAVVIPPTSSGRVVLPVEDAGRVELDGRRLALTPAVPARTAGGDVALEVPAGTSRLRVHEPRVPAAVDG